MRKVGILQSNYIPWKGYFDLINGVDLFIFYDDVQYTKNDWRNRNKIKTPNGESWLTIPTGKDLNRLICEVELKDHRWQKKHWKTICQYYAKAEYFELYREFFEEVYLKTSWDNLSTLNQFLIKEISVRFLGIETQFASSTSFAAHGTRMERLLGLLKEACAGSYVSGPAAKIYLDEAAFAEAGIELVYKSYEGYPQYTQFFPPFRHQVSIIDLLFHIGPDASSYIWACR